MSTSTGCISGECEQGMKADIWAQLRPTMAALEAKKAYHLVALDVSKKTSIADAFVICSAGSERHAQAVAEEVERSLREIGVRPLAVEGFTHGTWILLDYVDFIVHVFQEERREYYALERLWGDATEITSILLAPVP
jgi:ribosome-associated protein